MRIKPKSNANASKLRRLWTTTILSSTDMYGRTGIDIDDMENCIRYSK